MLTALFCGLEKWAYFRNECTTSSVENEWSCAMERMLEEAGFELAHIKYPDVRHVVCDNLTAIRSCCWFLKIKVYIHGHGSSMNEAQIIFTNQW
jgi:hypothetical protein